MVESLWKCRREDSSVRMTPLVIKKVLCKIHFGLETLDVDLGGKWAIIVRGSMIPSSGKR